MAAEVILIEVTLHGLLFTRYKLFYVPRPKTSVMITADRELT